MSLYSICITMAVCLIVGLLIGWSGIAGFLLPIFFTGYLGLPISSSLTISFFCFLISGCFGSFSYKSQGLLPLKPALTLSAGSFVGAILGVSLSRYIPTHVFMVILYLVVLLSGASILIRECKSGKRQDSDFVVTPVRLVGIGCITAVICSLSGAGGPVLVMPILLLCNFGVKEAVAIALFDSIFIAIPSFIGYSLRCDLGDILFLLFICGFAHCIGILAGGHTAKWIPVRVLKIGVSVFSIGIALFKLSGLLL